MVNLSQPDFAAYATTNSLRAKINVTDAQHHENM